MPTPPRTESGELSTVPIGRWAVAAAPARLRTLLGSCVGVVLHDRASRIGGVAHVVLPCSDGLADDPGRYADTAIPAMIADLDRLRGRPGPGRLVAKIIGGASMFQAGPALDIGRRNAEAVERALALRNIPIIGRDVGGESGRRLTLDTATGGVTIRLPSGGDYEV